MKILWTDAALGDLDAFVSWLDLEAGPAVARKWASGIFDRVAILAGHPLAGPQVPEFDDEALRELHFRSLRIIYRVGPGTCAIVAVFHSLRKLSPDTFPR